MLRKVLLITLLVAVVVLVAGCGGKAECEADSDCTAQGACLQASCVQGACTTTPVADCCGNAQCEASAGENPCTCERDCRLEDTASGKCEGKVQVPNQYRPSVIEDAEYAQYYCEDDECVIGVPKEEVQDKQFFSETRSAYVKFQVVADISKPYVIGQGTFHYTITLSDIELSRARTPVTITSVQVLFRDELVGQQIVNKQLQEVSDYVEGTIALTPSLDRLEEQRTLTFKVNYDYQAVSRTVKDGQTVEDLSTDRSSFTTTFDQLVFIEPKVR